MTADHTRDYTCPHCGATKSIVSILSGNTFGGTFWSDCRAFYPMLPQPSPVQRCGKCRHFYYLRDLKPTTGSGYNGTQGELSWEDCKAALRQFQGEWEGKADEEPPAGAKRLLGELSEEDRKMREYTLRLLSLQAFNDTFYRRRHPSFRTSTPEAKPWESDEKLFRENALRLLVLTEGEPSQQLLRIEILRELGQFDEARRLLDAFKPDRNNPEKVANMMRRQVEEGNHAPFIIHGSDN